MSWKVLVVDDEVEIAGYVGNLVKKELGDDADVIVLSSGSAAKRTLKETPVDLLISDIVMPIINGFEILEWVAKYTMDTEVIFLTAHEEFDFIYRANKIKPCTYVVKAEKEEVIRTRIRQAIKKLEAQRSEKEIVEHAKLQIEEVKHVLSEEKARQMLSYEELNDSELELIKKIKDYVKENINENLTASAVASAFHYAPSSISKIFNKHGKEKLSVYILNQKMRIAMRLLIETDKSVQEIATDLGYACPQTFIRSFGRVVEITPLEYRRRYSK